MARERSIKTRLAQECGFINIRHPEEYKPWLHTKECSSGSGRRHIIRDPASPSRYIYLMSDLELKAYIMLRSSQDVLELFEQFPLDLSKTRYICELMNIIHPKHPKTHEDIVMTTDILTVVQTESGPEYRAFAVKPEAELKNIRVREKLLIEQEYWKSKQIKWAVITEKELKN